ncbi:hypothetical protein COO60DRAFT_1646246 [Scenedesmus sp. NREL 46B-D3]|nr:hypothetical protein COO60DRAFT_1646246 [Scenedesmus sp. NREL 46B-D3]
MELQGLEAASAAQLALGHGRALWLAVGPAAAGLQPYRHIPTYEEELQQQLGTLVQQLQGAPALPGVQRRLVEQRVNREMPEPLGEQGIATA